MQYLKQSTAKTFRIGPFLDEDNGKSAEPALTIVQADIQISKAGAAFAQTSAGSPTTTHDSDGWYQCPLTTADTGTLGLLDVQIHVAGALPVWRHFNVVPANIFDSMFSTDKLQVDVTQLGGVAQSATDLKHFADTGYDPATSKVEGVKLADTTTTNTDMVGTNSAALASVCTEARLVELAAANLPAVIDTIGTNVGAVLNDTEVGLPNRLTNIDGALGQIDTVVDAVLVDTAELQAKATAVVSGAFTGTPTTTTGNTDLTGFAANVFIDRYIYITSGTYQGGFAKITDYVVASGVLTYEALSGAPAATDTFVIA